MSEIDAPSNIPLQTGEGATRVTRASNTSDDSSAQQQSTKQKTTPPERTQESTEKPASHETAVTLSSNLSNLETGSQINANYLGIDGEDRPLIASESGTYVVKYDLIHQQNIDRIPQGATLEVKILKVEREIEARLILPIPATEKNTSPPVSIPVTLELIGLGSGPLKVRTPTDQGHLPQNQLTTSYQAADLYRAESIARESANKLNELPLPATTTNYTLYEKAVPQHNRPAIIRSVVAGNALIAQEQIVKATVPAPSNPGPTTVATNLLSPNIEKILHKDTLATVVKNIPRAANTLPEIVRKHLGTTSPLDRLKAGHSFTLRIESLAVPGIRPDIQTDPVVADSRPAPTIGDPVKNEPITASVEGLSGIIIAPGKNIQQHIPKEIDRSPPLLSRGNNRYPDRYGPSSAQKPPEKSSFMTLYAATPVSVIKFQSPIELHPGTIINFSLPELAEAKTTAQKENTEAKIQPAQKDSATGWIATSPVTRPGPASAVELPPQPLENLLHNWQSLSQIISVVPPVDGSGTIQSLNNRIPGVQSPGQMTSAMVFFLAAMGARNPAHIWLGPKITQQLEKAGQGKLLTMLDNDMQRIFRLGAETPVNEWRPALIPLQVGNDISAIPLLIRKLSDDQPDGKNNSDEDDDHNKNNATRFIVEIDLTQFGQLQVDGLLKAKKLNIIIRSKIILPPEMKKHMTILFTTALEVSGYNGDLKFRDNARPALSVRDMVDQKIHMFKA